MGLWAVEVPGVVTLPGCRCSLNSGPVVLFENWATWLV
jgi:hypothetical protein